LFSILLSKLYSINNLYKFLFGAPALWMITEFLRGWIMTGFPWLQFGYSQIDGPLKGIAPIFGVEAITFILVMMSGFLTYSLIERNIFSTILLIIILFSFRLLNLLHWYQLQPERAINVALVQGNVHLPIKYNFDPTFLLLNVYLKNTLPILDKAKIIIWPELALSINEMNRNNFLSELNQYLYLYHTNLITGIIDNTYSTSINNVSYNSIIVIGESIPYRYSTKNRYYKHHLVPFGETIPFQLKPLAFLFNLPINSLQKGNYLQSQLKVADMKITSAICYEIILGHQIQNNFHSDTDFILTIANDIWFGYSIGPWQHFQMARMRSLELGRPLLRSSNNGITAVINADGTIQKKTSSVYLCSFKC